MKRRSICAVLVAVGLLGILAAAASAVTPGFGLGIQAGYGESKDAENGSPIVGVHAALNLASWLGVVGMFDYKFPEDYKQDDADYTVKSFPMSVMARVYLPVKSFSPYVAAGFQYRLITYGGDLFDDDSYELDDSDTSFGWLAGAGAVLKAGSRAELFGEFRYEASDPDRNIDNAVQNAKDFVYDQWSARGGITFRFNK